MANAKATTFIDANTKNVNKAFTNTNKGLSGLGKTLSSIGKGVAKETKRTPLSRIHHDWFEDRGYRRIAGINLSFFTWQQQSDPVGLSYVDEGFLLSDTKADDEYVELIMQNEKLYIDDVTSASLMIKYPKAL